MAAVFWGALTYIGNGPNFMVKAIAESAGVETPSFVGYVVKYSLPILVPIYILVWVVFFSGYDRPAPAGHRRRAGGRPEACCSVSRHAAADAAPILDARTRPSLRRSHRRRRSPTSAAGHPGDADRQPDRLASSTFADFRTAMGLHDARRLRGRGRWTTTPRSPTCTTDVALSL